MKLKFVIITTIMIFFLVNIVTGTVSDTDLLHWYTFDDTETSGNILTELVNGYNFTKDAGVISGIDSGVTHLGEEYNFLGGADGYVNDNVGFDITSNFTYGIWYRHNDSQCDGADMLFFHGSTEYYQVYHSCGANNFQVDFKGSGRCQFTFPEASADNSEHLIIILFNGTADSCDITGAGQNMWVFVDNVSQTLTGITTSGQINDINPSGNLYIASTDGSGSNSYNGNINEFFRFDRAVTGQELAELYDSGNGLQYPFEEPGGDTPSLTLSTNLTTGDYITDLSFNVTGVAINITSNLWNCSSYLNGTINETALNIPINNTYQIFNLTYGNQEVGYDINVTCERWDYGLHVVDDVVVNNVFIDTVPPELEISATLSNNSILFRYIDILNFSVTYNDTNLFAVNLSIFKLNGDLSINMTMNQSFQDNINSTGYVINYTGDCSIDFTNLVNWTSGKYKIVGEAWDDHTKKTIKDYKIVDTLFNGKKAYQIEDGIYIFGNDFKKIDFIKEDDRYTFDVDFNKKNPSIEIYASDLKYLPTSDYDAHFVSVQYNKWIDFEANIDYEVFDYGNGYYLIVFVTDLAKAIKFKSIGDLNYNIKEWFFNISQSMYFHARDVFTNLSISNFSVTVWNGSTLIDNRSTTNGIVGFNFTGNYSTNFTSETHADNQTGTMIFSLGGNFTYYVFASNSLYIFIRDEITDTLITDRNVTVQIINYDNTSTEVTTDSGSTFQSGFSTGTYQLRYSADGYNTRSYYTTITGSDTQQILLYMLNSSEATTTFFVNEDETGNRYESGTVKGYRYFIGCNCWRVVEMDKTNFNGIGVLSLQHHETNYRFIVEYQGETVYSSTATEGYKITDTTYTLIWTLLGDTTESFFGTTGLYTSLVNTSDSFQFTVNDPTSLVDRFCLYAWQYDALTSTGKTQICNSCLNSSSGTISCNVSSYIPSGKELVAQGWIHTDTQYSSYWTDAISMITDLEAVATMGTLGVFLGLLFLLTGTFAGLIIAGLGGALIFFDIIFILIAMTKMIMVSLPVVIFMVAISMVILILISKQ